ncbi:B-family DNA polymerase, partial [Helicosporidium sp. ATCC 50920]
MRHCPFLRSSNGADDPAAPAGDDGRETAAEEEAAKALHERFGFEILTGARERLGWLINYHSSVRVDKETGENIGCICCYFACQDGSMFQVSVDCPAYMYVVAEEALTVEVDGWLRRKFAADVVDIVHVEREDPNLPNHLSGLKRKLLQLVFRSQEALQRVRRELAPIVARNKQGSRATAAYEGRVGGSYSRGTAGREAPPRAQEAQRGLLDLREHDVAHHMRFAIDSDVRCGHWYEVSVQEESALLRRRADLVQRAEVRVCAFDIETTKLPLQFPNAEYDQVFMISYMVDRQGYLIINREVVSEDVADFEYTPKPEFEGPFRIFNCADERACLERWFAHMREAKPAVYVTYNGDYFDWPFVETRAARWGLDMGREIGFRCAKGGGETRSRSAVHMDCMHWVNRDSYLPQGSRGLKAVTKYKLGYDPVEVDPEDMVRFAAEKPQAMASYSVSDAVATYYLYMTYVHPFIFSLSTIIPMPPDEVLRKGSGTLCEALLMVQASQAGVVAPNKHQAAAEKSHEGHLLDSETYIGGKVEALESGVFRSDLPCSFRLDAAAYARLARSLDDDLAHALRAEGRMEPEDAENYAEVRADILARLAALEAEPVREEAPLIYHLDVAAMYPNIILTNRLQPNAIVSAQDCAACDFNRPGKTCLREMDWVWRGEAFAAGRSDYARIKAQLQSELFPAAEGGAGEKRTWFDLPHDERQRLVRDRLKKFCQKTYKRVLNKPVTERRRAGVCQRENSFYYDTVEAFRDRRYEYKGLSKEWKGRLDAARRAGDPIEVQKARDMCVLYDSLQLAHKCILNSFYGYVMRKGARWYSMEMAGVVTHAGANIIKLANELVSAVGRPLELDTDGIWCALPGSFPEDFVFRARGGGKEFKMSYPCAVLNALVASSCANDQFAVLEDAGSGRRYRTESRMSIEFEVDGPYRAMVLPASKEEGKLIKKRYAVFNHDGSLAELKGFELKRRGELKLIKVFQAEVFDRFLLGGTLEECYAAVAAVADQWLDLLDTRGVDVTDAELVDLISETCVMSKTLEEYEGRKSCAVTCATRLSHFLGDSRIKDKGLVCHYLVARSPADAPTSERAIPVAIFSTEPAVARTFLARWCGDAPGGDWEQPPDVRAIVDWAYYRERLGSAIQKIVTIPAAMQRLPNPVPRVAHPAWLLRRVREKDD